MGSRLEFQSELETILGTRNVYFQPPESVKLIYPCIVYKKSDINISHADDRIYTIKKRYAVTVIDRNPDSSIVIDILAKIPLANYDRQYAANNLNHDVCTIYY